MSNETDDDRRRTESRKGGAGFVYLGEGELVRAARGGAGGGTAERALRSFVEARIGGWPPDTVAVFLEHDCAQACVFCEHTYHPARRLIGVAQKVRERLGRDAIGSGAFDALCTVLDQPGPPVRIRVTGHDWTAHGRRDAMLERLERLRHLEVEFEGPSTGLADAALRHRVVGLPTLRRVVVSLHSSDDRVHDALTRTPGGAARVREAIVGLRAAGVQVHVNTVATDEGLHGLAELGAWLAERGCSWLLLGWLPDRVFGGWDGRFAPPRVDRLRAALDEVWRLGTAGELEIGCVPPCAIPDGLRDRLPDREWAGASPVRGALEYVAACDGCAARSACVGLPGTYIRQHGATGIRPVPSRP